MLVVHDFGLIALIANEKKSTHRVPAGVGRDGYLSHPKVQEGTEHKVYERAPFGSHGSKHEPWYVTVYVELVWNSTPYEWQDEDMLPEGFTDLYSYGVWWNHWRAGTSKLCKSWIEMQDEQFWCFLFRYTKRSVHFDGRFEQYRRDTGLS